jgi:hypothetical protein
VTRQSRLPLTANPFGFACSPTRGEREPVGQLRRASLLRRASPRSHVKERDALKQAEGRLRTNQEDCEAPKGRVLFLVGSLSAPRLRRYVRAPSPRLSSLPRDAYSARQRWTWAFQPRRGADEPLRWSVTPAARARATAFRHGPLALAVLLRRRVPRPKTTDGLQLASSWTRDEVSVIQAEGGENKVRTYPSPRGEGDAPDRALLGRLARRVGGTIGALTPHPAIPARCRARHPPLKGRDEATLFPSPLVGEGFPPRSCASEALRKSHGGKGEG